MARKVTKLGRSVGTQLFSRNNAGGAGPDGTQYYVELTVQSSQVSSTLTDFPVYVDLSTLPFAFFENVQSDGGDIRVTESDGATRCPVDLVSIDTSGSTGELHFLASSLSSSSDTTFRIYYDAGGGLSQPGAATTYGRNAVWADYDAVWHLEEDPSGSAPQFVDSTGNGFDLTANGSMTSGDSIAGVLGQGVDLDGVDDYLIASSAAMGTTADDDWTISAWVLTRNNTARTAIAGKLTFSGFSDSEWGLSHNDNSGLQVRLSDDVTEQTAVGSDGSAVTQNVWKYLAGVANGIILEAYINGVIGSNNQSVTGLTPDLTSDPFLIGRCLLTATGEDTPGWHDGQVDEVRVRIASLSSAWIAAEYTNQNTPTTFYTVGSQTTV